MKFACKHLICETASLTGGSPAQSTSPNSLLRYSGGGLGWGHSAFSAIATLFGRTSPHPTPPPEYRRREKTAKRVIVPLLALLVAMLCIDSRAQAGPFDATGEGPANVSKAELQDVTVVEHLGAQLPLDLTFNDENGSPVQLRQYFTGKKPVVLQLGYYRCPMLCSLISQGLVNAVKEVSLTAGKDYDLVFVSIDPHETPTLAMQKKQAYLNQYGRESSDGWHFLTGTKKNIEALAEADGFKYKWIQTLTQDGMQGQYAHPPALSLCMPDGKISRYLYGVKFDPFTLRESLVEASNGKVGNAGDEIYLTCFRYDGSQGKYAFAAINIMRGGGVVIMVIVALVLVRMFKRERRLRALQEAMETH